MHNTLILDANQRSALAATRSLGRQGLRVITGDSTRRTLAGASKYSRSGVVYPSPSSTPGEFVDALAEIIQRERIDVLFPMTDITTALVLKHRQSLPPVLLACPGFEIYDAVTDKSRLFKLAQELGLPMPTTHYIAAGELVGSKLDGLSFPVVLKPARSRVYANNRWMNTSVKVARTRDELHELLSTHAWFRDYPYLVQEYIHGQGQGIFALYDHGRPLAFFAHKRLREKPPEGGVSVLSESVTVTQRQHDVAEALLTPLGWHGVAMVEFKVSVDGTPYLMEINGRFWGSLQLAVDAGVDFPYMLYQLAVGDKVEFSGDYRTGIKSRWLLGDLDHLYLILKAGGDKYGAMEKLRALGRFFTPMPGRVRHEINRLDDFAPFIFELQSYLGFPLK